jgi:hypothetical protein
MKPPPNVNRQYSGRPSGIVPLSLSIEKDAYTLMVTYSPGRKAHGRFLSRLIYEHAAREEARREVRHEVLEVYEKVEEKVG